MSSAASTTATTTDADADVAIVPEMSVFEMPTLAAAAVDHASAVSVDDSYETLEIHAATTVVPEKHQTGRLEREDY